MLISEPGKTPIAIDASGYACKNADLSYYNGLSAIPSRGPKAALTMAGAVSGWQKALDISKTWQSPCP
ncbi:gamma-glutamyltransferase [Paraglaciecola sp. Hal342]